MTKIVLVLCILPVLWLGAMIAYTVSLSSNLFTFTDNLSLVLSNPLSIQWTDKTAAYLMVAVFVYGSCIAYHYATKKNTRPGEEHGSAKWGNSKAINAKYKPHGKEKENYVVISENMTMGLDGRKHKRNLHTLIIGGSGAGKSMYYARPNIMLGNSSLVITDPKGELLRSTGHLLEKDGYVIKVFNLMEMHKSFQYNPFVYLQTDSDALRLINNLIKNTTPKGSSSSDPFWEKAETALLSALMLYLRHEAPQQEQNFPTLMYLLENSGANEDSEDYVSAVDIIFEELEEEEPTHIAVRQYKVFKQAAGKTAKSILVSAAVRLAAFTLPELIDITSRDELELHRMGDRKQALFCIIPDNDNTFNYLIGMMYTQIYQALYHQADYIHQGPLPVPVRVIADEFANVAVPENFEIIQSTMRSRNIHISIIIQDLNQIKKLFEKSWQTVVSNCDTLLYLGSNEPETHKYLSEMLGKETVDITTRGLTHGRSGSSSENFQTIARELMTPDEIRRMDNDYSIVIIRGEYPLWDKKFNLWKHPRIKEIDIGGAPMYLLPEIRYQLPDLLTEINLDDIIIESMEAIE